jgi:hypothetical protein
MFEFSGRIIADIYKNKNYFKKTFKVITVKGKLQQPTLKVI